MIKRTKKLLKIAALLIVFLFLLVFSNQTLFVDGDFGHDWAVKAATEAAMTRYPDFDYEKAHVDVSHGIRSQRLAMWIPIYIEFRQRLDVFFTNSEQTEYVAVQVNPYLTFMVKDVEYGKVKQ